MGNSKRKCKQCSEYKPAETMVKHPIGTFCGSGCVIAFTQKAQTRARAKLQAKAKKEYNQETKRLREKIRKRTGVGGYYESLKIALHYYVKHCLRKGEPCYTCDKPQKFEDSGGAFHVGHYMPAGSVDPRRFMIANLRIQCFSCNAAKSGNQAEYRKRLTAEMGIDHVEWLESIVNHKSLEDQYPTVDSIQAEARKYRAMIKALKSS